MAADIMQAQVEPTYGADQMDQSSSDESIDIVNNTPDTEAAQQHGTTSPFAAGSDQEEAGMGEDMEMQEVTPEPQLLPPPVTGAPLQVIEQHLSSLVRGTASDAARQPASSATPAAEPAAAVNGSANSPISFAGDSSGEDEAPLVSMRSQDVSASAQRSGSAEEARQQQHDSAQSRPSPTPSIGRQCLHCCC